MNTFTGCKKGFVFNGIVFAAITLFGCGGEQGAALVSPKVSIIDKVSHALTPNSVRSIQGIYGTGCLGRSGAWEIPLNGYAATLPALSVVKDNTSCTLSVSAILAGAAGAPSSYSMASSLPLGASFGPTAAAFSVGGLGATDFYANFRVQPDLSFGTDFVIEMVYSDDASQVAAAKAATFAVQTGSATASAVPAADYTIDLIGINIQVDASNVVQSSSGSAQLLDGLVTGEQYVVDMDTLPASPTFADLDAAFLNGTSRSIAGNNPSIPASELNLAGLDLSTPQYRNIIVVHTQNGTRAYQLFRITFNHP